MPRRRDSGRLELQEVFCRMQEKLCAELAVGGLFEHPASHGNASELLWLALLRRYLPKRYGVAPAFVINAKGGRSRQIDVAIYDCAHSAPLFPHEAGMHLPVESVYAVFEVKSVVSKVWLDDAAEKIASVRALQSSNRVILGGLLAGSSDWPEHTFEEGLRRTMRGLRGRRRIDLGCALDRAGFEMGRTLRVSWADEALMFFVLRLLGRLHRMGSRRTDVGRYWRG